MHDSIPLLTDIIKPGDKSKAGEFRESFDDASKRESDTLQILNEPFDLSLDETETEQPASASSSAELSLQIEQAIDDVLPEIKQRLHEQLLSKLSKA